MKPLEDGDKLIKNYVKDQARHVECWIFEDKHGKQYQICQDQDGQEWLEDYEE